MPTATFQNLVAALVVAVTIAAPVDAQDDLYTTSIQQQSFKGTHNSYEKQHTVKQQIDSFNTWFVELDCCFTNSGWEIKHPESAFSCGTDAGVATQLNLLATAAGSQSHVVFVWLDIKNDFGCCGLDAGWLSSLKLALQQGLGADRIYTRSEFIDVDHEVWPSVGELLQRGRNFIIVLDENEEKPEDGMLFVSASSLANAASNWPHARFINRSGGSLPSGETVGQDPRFLWRAYGLDSADKFDTALDRGFHFPCTDDYQEPWSYDQRTHPPVPMHYQALSFQPPFQYGTALQPFVDLDQGRDWAVAHQELRLFGGPVWGHYTVTPGQPLVFAPDKPLILTLGNGGGPATIGP